MAFVYVDGIYVPTFNNPEMKNKKHLSNPDKNDVKPYRT